MENVTIKLNKIIENKSIIRNLKNENEVLLKDVLSDILLEVKSMENDNYFKLFTKKQKISYLKIKYANSSSIYGICCDYLSLNLTIDFNLLSTSLFRDLVSLNKNGYISKNSLNNCKTNEDYLNLRKKGNEIKKETLLSK